MSVNRSEILQDCRNYLEKFGLCNDKLICIVRYFSLPFALIIMLCVLPKKLVLAIYRGKNEFKNSKHVVFVKFVWELHDKRNSVFLVKLRVKQGGEQSMLAYHRAFGERNSI